MHRSGSGPGNIDETTIIDQSRENYNLAEPLRNPIAEIDRDDFIIILTENNNSEDSPVVCKSKAALEKMRGYFPGTMQYRLK